jgi:hypothetical protein
MTWQPHVLPPFYALSSCEFPRFLKIRAHRSGIGAFHPEHRTVKYLLSVIRRCRRASMLEDLPPMPTVTSRRSLWIFARPFSLLPPLGLGTQGRFYFCHWGVLITDLKVLELENIVFQSQSLTSMEDAVIGTMFELKRTSGIRITPKCTRPFTGSILKENWKNVTIHHAGMTDMLDDQIDDLCVTL